MKLNSFTFSIISAVLIIAALTVAGCADYVPNRDITLIKLHQNGTTDWIKTIDTGFDDYAEDIIRTQDGGFVVAAQKADGRYGPYNSGLIRLSPDGTKLWDYPLTTPDLTTPDDCLTSVVQTGDGGFTALSQSGSVIRLGPEGNLLWSTKTGICDAIALTESKDGGFAIAGVQEDSIQFGMMPVYSENGTVSSREPLPGEDVITPGCHETYIQSGDVKIPVTECTPPVDIIRQAAVLKLDSSGKILWQRAYGASNINSASSIIKSSENNGFFLTGYETKQDNTGITENYIVACLLDEKGSALKTVRFDKIEYFKTPLLREAPGGYDILYINTTLRDGYYFNRRAEAHFDVNTGKVTPGCIPEYGIAMTWTDDGGYFTAGFGSSGRDSIYGRNEKNILHTTYFNGDGNRVWNRDIPKVPASSVTKIIRMADGGYMILALKENY